MYHHTNLDENLEGADNFRAWKYRISLVLEENELDSYINEEVLVPEGNEAKALHKKNLVKAKRIIADSIKDHLLPHSYSLKTPKEMFDSLTKLFEGKKINQKKYRNFVILEEIDLDQYFSKKRSRSQREMRLGLEPRESL